jgi:hypothetical protein
MQVGRPAIELKVSMTDRAQLESIARSQSPPASLSRRAQINTAPQSKPRGKTHWSRRGLRTSARSQCSRWVLGYVEGITHDYIRHGTTTLFAALDIANDRVLTPCGAASAPRVSELLAPHRGKHPR